MTSNTRAMSRYGIALIGCGFIGRVHARALRGLIQHGLLDARLVVACDLDASRAESMEFEHATTSSDAALSNPDVNVVYLCVPTAARSALFKAAIEYGHAIFCEKPLALNAREAQQMAEAASSAVQVGLVLRYSPVYVVLHSLIDTAGPLLAATFRDDQAFPIGRQYGSTWRGDVSQAGGGTLIEHSIHDVDLLRWYFGEVVRVSAATRYVAGHHGIEDVAAALLQFESGMVATLLSVWHGVDERHSERHLEIFGRDRMLDVAADWEGPVATLSIDEVRTRYRELQGIPHHMPAEYAHGYVQQSVAFFRALQEGRAPWPSLHDAVAAHRIIDAIYQSAREGTQISLLPSVSSVSTS